MVNYSDLARDTGIAPNTARKWVGLLETSGIVAIIEPYFANRTKRLIKTPKLVFLDTGLAAFLAGFRSERELTQSPLVGAFWESHVIGQLIRLAASRAMSDAICYWRTAGGQEVDIVIERAGDVTAIECKWEETPRASDAHGLNAMESAEPGKVKEKIIVCRTQASYRLPDVVTALATTVADGHNAVDIDLVHNAANA